jgi:hypothetical protein
VYAPFKYEQRKLPATSNHGGNDVNAKLLDQAALRICSLHDHGLRRFFGDCPTSSYNSSHGSYGNEPGSNASSSYGAYLSQLQTAED